MNKNLVIAIIVILIAVGVGLYFGFRQQGPSPTAPSGEQGPLEGLKPVELPPAAENTTNLAGIVTDVSRNSISLEVSILPPIPAPTPDQIQKVNYEIQVADDTVIRALIYQDGIFNREEAYRTSDLEVGQRITVTGLDQGGNVIQGQLIQLKISIRSDIPSSEPLPTP